MKTVFQNITLPDGNGRFFLNGTVDQIIQVPQLVQFLPNLHKQRTSEFLQKRFQMRQHSQGSFKRYQIPRIRSLITDPPDQPLQIIDRAQIFPQLLSCNQLAVQFLYGCQTLLNRFSVN